MALWFFDSSNTENTVWKTGTQRKQKQPSQPTQNTKILIWTSISRRGFYPDVLNDLKITFLPLAMSMRKQTAHLLPFQAQNQIPALSIKEEGDKGGKPLLCLFRELAQPEKQVLTCQGRRTIGVGWWCCSMIMSKAETIQTVWGPSMWCTSMSWIISHVESKPE